MDFDNISFEMPKNRSAAIKVIGVGGGGSNAVNYMFEQGITGVDFIVSNTDAQALQKSPVPVKIQLGANITEGLGAGANPEIGEQAAIETLDDIKRMLDSNTKMAFITAGMGGGTGTGAAPIIAKCAREMGILTVGICTAPFSFEGKKRIEQAKEGIEKLRASVDSLIIINNDKLRELYGNLGYKTGFTKADEVLATAAKGIAEVITHEYSINIDLHDAKTVLANSGTAIMGSAKARGEDKAKKAIESALDSPLLNDNKIIGAQNVLLLIISGEDEITMDEIGIINDHIQSEAGNNANIIMGMGQDDSLGDEISVTIVATGFPLEQQEYSGVENKTIIHTLDTTDDVSLPLSVSISNKNREMEKTQATESKIDSANHENTFDENENNIYNFKVVNKIVDEDDSKNEITDNLPSNDIEDDEDESDKNYKLFSLDDNWEEEPKTPSISRHSSVSDKTKEENFSKNFGGNKYNSTNYDSPSRFEPENNYTNESSIIEEVKVKEEIKTNDYDEHQKQINERRKKLKKFNYRFNSYQKEEKEELLNVPAYKRQGIKLSEYEHQRPSRYIVDEDKDNNIKIRPNNFLHDNVD